MNIKDLKEKILDEIRYGELNNDMGYVPEWLGKTDMPRHAEDEKCFRDGVTCKRYTDAVIVKTAFDEFEKTDAPDINVGTKWIPCSERLPEELTPVNVTWVNRKPAPYYENIKNIPFTATAVYCNKKWFWWSSICEDILAEYGRNDAEMVDGDVEIIAWMPLPEPYKESEEQHGTL